MILESVITCPHCGTAKSEVMPTDACVFLYDCTGCGARLWAKTGDCCVFCSYGTVPCPPIQVAGASGMAASCCSGTDDSDSKHDMVVSGNERPGAKRRIFRRRVAAEKRRLSHRTRHRNFVRQLRG